MRFKAYLFLATLFTLIFVDLSPSRAQTKSPKTQGKKPRHISIRTKRKTSRLTLTCSAAMCANKRLRLWDP